MVLSERIKIVVGNPVKFFNSGNVFITDSPLEIPPKTCWYSIPNFSLKRVIVFCAYPNSSFTSHCAVITSIPLALLALYHPDKYLASSAQFGHHVPPIVRITGLLKYIESSRLIFLPAIFGKLN